MTDQMLDNAYFNQRSSAGFIKQCKNYGAKVAGLYLINLSAPSATHPPQFFKDVLSAGLGVLPIVTPNDYTEPTAAQIQYALDNAGMPLTIRTAHDIETYADPPSSNLSNTFTQLRKDGGSPGMYGNVSFSQYNPGETWKWWASYVAMRPSRLPAGFQAWQWTNTINGYDASLIDNAANFYSLAPSEEIMPAEIVQYHNPSIGPLPADGSGYLDLPNRVNTAVVNAWIEIRSHVGKLTGLVVFVNQAGTPVSSAPISIATLGELQEIPVPELDPTNEVSDCLTPVIQTLDGPASVTMKFGTK